MVEAADVAAVDAVVAEAEAAADAAGEAATINSPTSATAGALNPAYTGSVSLTLTNSALNASPFSVNGQPSVKAPSDRAAYTGTIGGPMVIPKLLNWQRASFNITYQGVGVPQREQMPRAPSRRPPNSWAISRRRPLKASPSPSMIR